MTNKELIQALKRFPKDAKITIDNWDQICIGYHEDHTGRKVRDKVIELNTTGQVKKGDN